MALTVDFSFLHDNRLWSSEAALGATLDLQGVFERPWDLEGTVTIKDDELDICWDDTLVPLVSAICLETLPTLAQTGHATAGRTTEYGYLRMDAEGAWIRLGGDGLPSGRVEREPFLHALLSAASRLIDLLVAIDLDGFDVKGLREDRSLAVRAIGTTDWNLEGAPQLPPIGPGLPREDADGPVTLSADGPVAWACEGKSVTLPGDRQQWLEAVRGVLPRLEAGKSAVAERPTSYGYARFDCEGDRVRISGDGMGDLRIPLAGFLETLR